MDNNLFDHRIKQALEGIEANYDVSSWESLNAKMEGIESLTPSETIEEEVIIKQKLEGLTPAYKPESWGALLSKLEEWEAFRRNLYAVRALEIALILLLVFTGLRQWNTYKIDSLENGETLAQSESYHVPSEEMPGEAELPSERVESVHKEVSKDGNWASNENVALNVQQKAIGEGREKNILETNGNTTNQESAFFNSITKGPIVPRTSDHVVDQDAIISEVESTDTEVSVGSHHTLSASNEEVLHEGELDLLNVQLSSVEDHNKKYIWPQSINWEEKKNRFAWIGMHTFAGLSASRVGESKNFDAAYDLSLAYGSGLSFCFHHGNWNIATGIEYEFKKIHPRKILRTGNTDDGYSELRFKEINLNYLNIPLYLQYKLLKKKRHELYAIGGVKLHIGYDVNYLVSEKFLNDNIASSPLPDGLSSVEKWANEEFSEEELDHSVSYFTGDVGFGYQFYLNQRMALFIQPTAEIFMGRTGIAPNGTRINTVKGDLGVRVRI